jgi:formiminotetrahydrofolate cyclodeaminase
MAARQGLTAFLDELAAATATPGGGSAAAASAAMGAALGAMVSRLTRNDANGFEDDRRFFTEAVSRDAEAFEQVMKAYKLPKEERGPHVEEALHGAALVPLEVLERACALLQRLEQLQVPARMASDLKVAKLLTTAAQMGMLENVRVNLQNIHDAAFKAEVDERLRQCPNLPS